MPRYEKLELAFQVANTVAANLQLPYDSTPPPGVEPGVGISVDAQFSQDGFATFHTQPAFYYQGFEHQIKSGREWFYPTQTYAWKVRFAPPTEGEWRYRIVAADASGTATSPPVSFTVAPSDNHGFVRVSQRDLRYFEFEDGTYFPGLGYNMNYDHIGWNNPTLDNQANFEVMGKNGIQLVRMWLSQWSIHGSAWNPWYGLRGDYGGYVPRTGLSPFRASPEDVPTFNLKLAYAEDAAGNKNTDWFDACRLLGGFMSPPAVKQDTTYRFRVRYRAYSLTGPRNPSFDDYGFVLKLQNPRAGNWHTNCFEPGTGNSTGLVISPYAHGTGDWAYLEGEWHSGTRDFLPNLYLALENVNAKDPATGKAPSVYIDTVEVRANLPDGSLGPNIVSKSSMEHHLYFGQEYSYRFDRVVELAERYGIYLKPVIMEKNDDIFNAIDFDGAFSPGFDNNRFYGDYRRTTRVRWLQQAWWRYLQARWGYSTSIHSWELLNEGDPFNSRHYALADEFGKYMREFTPNNHLVTTSFWHSFPTEEFWGNANYPNVDYADIHKYISEEMEPEAFADSAFATQSLSARVGAKTVAGAGKPTMRGEAGFANAGTGAATQLALDRHGIWLHKYLWGSINPGGLLESYWYDKPHIYGPDHDHRAEYRHFYNFVNDIPLNNGNYRDAEASVSHNSLRAWGQKDTLNGRAHLWIDNKDHTWKNVVDGEPVAPLTGTVTLSGLPAGSYRVSWFDTYSGSVSGVETIIADTTGHLALSLPTPLATDVAVKVDLLR